MRQGEEGGPTLNSSPEPSEQDERELSPTKHGVPPPNPDPDLQGPVFTAAQLRSIKADIHKEEIDFDPHREHEAETRPNTRPLTANRSYIILHLDGLRDVTNRLPVELGNVFVRVRIQETAVKPNMVSSATEKFDLPVRALIAERVFPVSRVVSAERVDFGTHLTLEASSTLPKVHFHCIFYEGRPGGGGKALAQIIHTVEGEEKRLHEQSMENDFLRKSMRFELLPVYNDDLKTEYLPLGEECYLRGRFGYLKKPTLEDLRAEKLDAQRNRFAILTDTAGGPGRRSTEAQAHASALVSMRLYVEATADLCRSPQPQEGNS